MTPPEGSYPRTFAEFIKRFDTEEACLAYVEQIRWPNGFVCPFCGVVGEAWRMGDFNRRRSRSRGLLFYRLMEGAVATDPHPYKALLTPQMRLPGVR